MKVAAVGLAMAVLLVVSAFAGHIVDADFDVPGGGYLRIQATGFDHSTWHPGAIGQQNTFEGWGGFGGTYDSYDGSFGALSTYVNAAARISTCTTSRSSTSSGRTRRTTPPATSTPMPGASIPIRR